jgi:hypothetical protein
MALAQLAVQRLKSKLSSALNPIKKASGQPCAASWIKVEASQEASNRTAANNCQLVTRTPRG